MIKGPDHGRDAIRAIISRHNPPVYEGEELERLAKRYLRFDERASQILRDYGSDGDQPGSTTPPVAYVDAEQRLAYLWVRKDQPYGEDRTMIMVMFDGGEAGNVMKSVFCRVEGGMGDDEMNQCGDAELNDALRLLDGIGKELKTRAAQPVDTPGASL